MKRKQKNISKNSISKNRFQKIIIISFFLLFLLTSILFKIFDLTDIWPQITGTLLGTISTAIITALLLEIQTDKEINHDKDVGIFVKKQEVYYKFVEELEKITQDGKINVPGNDDYDSSEEDELQHLIYQLGFVQMHAKKETAEKITEKTGKILSNISLIKNTSYKKNEIYANLAESIFEIVSLLKIDLYNSNEEAVSKNKFTTAIRASGAFDNELLSLDGRANELATFLKNLLFQLNSSDITKNKVSLNYRNLTEKDDLSKIASGYINIQKDRWIFINFKLRYLTDCYCYLTFDDNGDFWVSFKNSLKKDLSELNERYKTLQPKDLCIGFLSQSGDYRNYARCTDEDKMKYIKNLIERLEIKINKLFTSEE